jgi:hypothetical protein
VLASSFLALAFGVDELYRLVGRIKRRHGFGLAERASLRTLSSARGLWNVGCFQAPTTALR